MPPHPRPKWDGDFRVDPTAEVKALRAHAKERGIPARGRDHLLVATWNIANLGVQKRDDEDYSLLAEIVSWFDLVAVQEVNDDLSGLRALMESLPRHYRVLFSEASGNQERAAFVYDSRTLEQLEKVGRLVDPAESAQEHQAAGVSAALPRL